MDLIKIPPREVRDLMNIIEAYVRLSDAQPYTTGLTGLVFGAHAALEREIADRAERMGVTEAAAIRMYRAFQREPGFTIKDIVDYNNVEGMIHG